ncbi:hypothetical protein BpHYR1_029687 [Brachionus plicatilis]|uniref:Uncharacterized protein n=1 Tax=Brachionus plicatilis TaxID=10195 RepID=A0A3M7SBZ6_BRAPC|nr:hypothetical protein BpHYR1_029687 [Brachionus plicatilis]
MVLQKTLENLQRVPSSSKIQQFSLLITDLKDRLTTTTKFPRSFSNYYHNKHNIPSQFLTKRSLVYSQKCEKKLKEIKRD